MKKIAWITDTTATLPMEFIQKHHIHVVPLQIMFGEESFIEEVDITVEQFYQKISTSKVSPTSSQPSLGSFVELYEKLKEEYEVGIAIHASSELSGTYSTSLQAAEIAGFKLIGVDSRMGSYPLIKMMELGLALEEQGESAEKIAEQIRNMTKNAELYLVPADLEQLRKSGRLSSTQAIIGSLLGVKLIVNFQDGKVVLTQKVRTEKKVKQFLFDLIEEAAKVTNELAVIHADDEEKALTWKQEIQTLFPTLTVSTLVLCPVAGVHTGRGSMGISWIKKS